MGQIQVVMNGRSYRLACGDGEEARLQSLASMVKVKVDELALQFGQVGEDRLFLMSALLIADELLDARERLIVQSEAAADAAQSTPPPAAERPSSAPAKAADAPAGSSPPEKPAASQARPAQPAASVRKPARNS